MNIRYRIDLDEAEHAQLAKMLSGGKHAARRIKRAHILLAADAGISDEEINVPKLLFEVWVIGQFEGTGKVRF